jgi:hypothetical protein
MTRLYKLHVTDTFTPSGGLLLKPDGADTLEFNGVLYASHHGGSSLEKAEGEWHRTMSEAWLAAAKKVDERIAALTAQAALMRENAMGKVSYL